MAALVSAVQAADLSQLQTAIRHAEQAGLESIVEYSQAAEAAQGLQEQQVLCVFLYWCLWFGCEGKVMPGVFFGGRNTRVKLCTADWACLWLACRLPYLHCRLQLLHGTPWHFRVLCTRLSRRVPLDVQSMLQPHVHLSR